MKKVKLTVTLTVSDYAKGDDKLIAIDVDDSLTKVFKDIGFSSEGSIEDFVVRLEGTDDYSA